MQQRLAEQRSVACRGSAGGAGRGWERDTLGWAISDGLCHVIGVLAWSRVRTRLHSLAARSFTPRNFFSSQHTVGSNGWVRHMEEPPRKKRWVAPTAEAGWHGFAHQAAAFEFADAQASPREWPIWAVELDSNGRRSYVVASYHNFWKRYRALQSPLRHHYEVIRAGFPCHLYFDCEFCRRANPDLDGPRLMETLSAEVEQALTTIGAPAIERVVDLDSSTPKKFSRHLIIRLSGGVAFKSNSHVGRFVHALCASFLPRRASEPRIADVFVRAPVSSDSGAGDEGAPAGTPRVSFIDLSVYSRNRCFRLYKSSKMGKQVELLPAGATEEDLYFMPHAKERELFLASLASKVEPDAELLQVGEDRVDAQRAVVGGGGGGGGGGHALDAHDDIDIVRLPKPPMSDGAGATGALVRGDCPHPELATFVLTAWTKKSGLPCRAHKWSHDEVQNKLTLALGPENRWCAHIQRPHRSNGTFLRVDLQQRKFAQFCHDYECRAQGFRGSDELPIPETLCDQALYRGSRPSLGGALAELPLDDILAAYDVEHRHSNGDEPQPREPGVPAAVGPSGGLARKRLSGRSSLPPPAPNAPSLPLLPPPLPQPPQAAVAPTTPPAGSMPLEPPSEGGGGQQGSPEGSSQAGSSQASSSQSSLWELSDEVLFALPLDANLLRRQRSEH